MAAFSLVSSICLLVAIATGSGLAECPDEWVSFQESCYYFVNNHTTWHASSAYCQSQQSEIVAVDSQAENDFLVRYMRRLGCAFNTLFWIGATDMITDGVWVWTSSLSPLSYFNWGPNEPNGLTNEDCISVTHDSGTWNDFSCRAPLYYVCELKQKTCGVGSTVIG
ncbi:low affinity immunoglobulin epsilon Fc receptor-like isoform X2 [Mizuhopecten yessoensis]|uniref:Low affinity immunoglobulin epsilon Fc receptor n=1 Tax=Mizuhopecten yessoensis TaxID=6573 RepID=A0A210Q4S8_MIZYE|nr:low affinity immunoglobulin epsilon Fc receptor-like isoform X2 [Mizuhopecten yessoensis]OWF43738.1 Low affinity immunoglobulin epsilon Fc receptor [Mizuhopecten yessoensis]